MNGASTIVWFPSPFNENNLNERESKGALFFFEHPI